MDMSMRILITNDDGIRAEGIVRLVEWSRKLGEIVVVAPKNEQSAKGQSIILDRPFEIKQSDAFDYLGITSYSVDSTPADCVRVAADKLGKFDLCFSGINRGLNLGCDVAYSGTCGAALEANYAGITSIAFSSKSEGLSESAEKLDEIWDFISSNKLTEFCSMINVNIPKNSKGIRFTEQGGIFYRDNFIPRGNDMYMAQTFKAYDPGEHPDENIDTDAVFMGYISVSPLTIKRTDRDAINKFRNKQNV